MMTIPRLVIFTDLDGTLLDRTTFSFNPAEPALRLIQTKSIPLILSSSKTRAEIEVYRKRLENRHPFISENGGAVFVPMDYFALRIPYDKTMNEYFVIELGTPYLLLIEVLKSVKRETGIAIRGFSDLTEEEVSSVCGLKLQEARLAKQREYDEPFMIEDGGESEIIKKKIEEKGMNHVWGGKFHHLLGKNDKGKAVRLLKGFYEKQFSSILTIGIGDSLNDIPMLLAVDHPIFLKEGDDPSPEPLSTIQNLTLVEGTGPEMWNEAILNRINELE